MIEFIEVDFFSSLPLVKIEVKQLDILTSLVYCDVY